MVDARLTTRLIEDECRLELDAAELRVVSGPDKGLKIALSSDSVLVGTAASCDVVLTDSTVSQKHLEIVAGADGYLMRDLKSKNGVFLGNFRIERAPLADGMRVRIGETTLLVRSLGKRQSIALSRSGTFGNLIAHSVKMRALVNTLTQLAATDVTVLIEGETGTGKEVAANALHSESPRKRGPWVVFDCGAVSRSLMGAELFGYERGAFTGADAARAGLLESADGGTFFLDEIGELPLDLQPLLLGAIERRSSRRAGGRVDIQHDVRIVAATNRNLAEEVRAGRFREDLYFRLAVGRVRMPPLRERLEDIPLMAERFAGELGGTVSPKMMDLLSAHDWPGNVRELRNTVQYLIARPDEVDVFAGSKHAVNPELFEVDGKLRELPNARQLANEGFEARYLAAALSLAKGNVTHAAELCGVARQTLSSLINKHGLSRFTKG